MSGIKIANGTAASAETTVDTNGNMHVVTPTTESQAGFVSVTAENDSGAVTGSRLMRSIETTEDYRLRVGLDAPMFDLSFEGTVVSQAVIQQNLATMTGTQANGLYLLNAGSATASGNNANIRTYRAFPLFGTFSTYCEIWAKTVNETASNSVTEWGLGYVSGTSAPTDGVFFRSNAGGQLMGVVNFGGSETTVNLSSPATNTVHHWAIEVHNEQVNFWVNDTLYGSIATPTGYASPSQSYQQPAFARIYNSGLAGAARQFGVGKIAVTLGEAASARSWSHAMVGMGGASYQIQPGTASGGTLTRGAAATGWPTSGTASAAAATYTATSAPATNSLGGMYTTPAISTLTTDADYPIFSYLNPAGSATLPGKTLYITGVRVSEVMAKTAASTNTCVSYFALGIGSTSSATTATEGAAIVAARIIPVGMAFWPSTAAIGDTKGGWTLDFSQAPLVCPPNTYVQFIFRPSGTVASNTLTLHGMVTFMGYHE